MSIYETLGVSPVINAAGPVTRLSGAPLHPEVAAAMAEAAQHCVRIEDLQAAAGQYLAEVTGAEAGYVVAGAAAGLALAAAACIAGLDVAAMDRLPDTTGLPDEIVVQRAHLTAYTHALRVAGARLVEVGYLGYPGQGITWPWQVEAAINERTAALAWSVGSAEGLLTDTTCQSSSMRPPRCRRSTTCGASSRPAPTSLPSAAARRSAGRRHRASWLAGPT